MTTDADALRSRLAALDPLRGGSVDPVTSPRAHQLLERTMQTLEEPDATAAPRPSRWRRPALLATAAAAVVAVGVGTAVIAANTGDDGSGGTRAKPTSTLALNVPGGVSMVSCVPFDVKFLRDMPVALAGTVTAVEPGKVTLDVDRWYKGGTAGRVTIAQPDPQSSVALDGVTFEDGKRYLLTATNGTVNGCGFSGPATPELERSYAEAFGGQR